MGVIWESFGSHFGVIWGFILGLSEIHFGVLGGLMLGSSGCHFGSIGDSFWDHPRSSVYQPTSEQPQSGRYVTALSCESGTHLAFICANITMDLTSVLLRVSFRLKVGHFLD